MAGQESIEFITKRAVRIWYRIKLKKGTVKPEVTRV